MGNVDTVRQVVKNIKAVRGPDSGPGSLMWYTIFDYIFFNSFRIFQYAQLEKKLDRINTFKELQYQRKILHHFVLISSA